MNGIIPTDSVWINGVNYKVDDGFIVKSRIFPELNYQVAHEDNSVLRGDLNPALQNYEIPDFFGGMGLYIDNGQTFSRKAYYSTLDHQNPNTLTLSARRQAAGIAGITALEFIWYNGLEYALTSSGLYYYDTGTDTFTAVGGTPAVPYYHAVIHRGYLWLAGGSANNLVRFDGTTFVTPAGNEKAALLAEVDNRLFSVETVSTVPYIVKVRYSEDLGVTWLPAVLTPAGAEGGLPDTGLGPQGVATPPQEADGRSYLYVATASKVYKVDWQTGRFFTVFDMSNAIRNGNGRALYYWSSTNRLYVNQKSTMIEIDLDTTAATVVGPDFNVRQAGVPIGLPSGYRAEVWNCVASDPNFLYVGSYPTTGNKAVILGMSADRQWYFFTVNPSANSAITAMHGADVDSGFKLYFGEQPPTGADPGARWLDFNADFSEEGEVHTPWLTAGLPDVLKTFYDLQVEASALSADEKITISYRLDFNEATAGTFSAITLADTAPYTRTFGTVPTSVGVSARAIKFVVKFNRAAGTTTVTPFQYHMNLRWRPTSPARYSYTLNLTFDSPLTNRDKYTNFLSTLETALESVNALYFFPSGDNTGTAINVIPVQENLPEHFEQAKRTGKLQLKLLQIL